MLQRRCRRGEVNRLLVILVGQEAIDESAHKRVSSADTVNDVCDVIAAGLEESLSIEYYPAPGIVVGVDRAAQGDGHLLAARGTLP